MGIRRIIIKRVPLVPIESECPIGHGAAFSETGSYSEWRVCRHLCDEADREWNDEMRPRARTILASRVFRPPTSDFEIETFDQCCQLFLGIGCSNDQQKILDRQWNLLTLDKAKFNHRCSPHTRHASPFLSPIDWLHLDPSTFRWRVELRCSLPLPVPSTRGIIASVVQVSSNILEGAPESEHNEIHWLVRECRSELQQYPEESLEKPSVRSREFSAVDSCTFLLLTIGTNFVSTDASFVFSFEIEEARLDTRALFGPMTFFGFAIETNVRCKTIDQSSRTKVQPLDLTQPNSTTCVHQREIRHLHPKDVTLRPDVECSCRCHFSHLEWTIHQNWFGFYTSLQYDPERRDR